ncbi:hypothetical protein HP2RS_02779, partial [Helicobacter pylori]
PLRNPLTPKTAFSISYRLIKIKLFAIFYKNT